MTTSMSPSEQAADTYHYDAKIRFFGKLFTNFRASVIVRIDVILHTGVFLMKRSTFTFAALTILIAGVIGFGLVETPSSSAKSRQSTALIGLLPSSDAVMGFDSRRFFNEAMPQILSANKPMLSKIAKQLDELNSKAGIDLRKFDAVAVGLAVTRVKDNEFDFDPVAIARGDVNSGALIALAKLAANGKYREEKVGDRTIYVFSADSAKGAISQTAGKSGPAVDDMIGRTIDGFTKEMAISAIDGNTLAIGSLARVRATLEGSTKVSPEITSLLAGKENAVMSFAMADPAGMAKMIPLDNDELGSNIDSIKFVSGSMDVAAAGTSLAVSAQTVKPEQAKSLSEMLEGLQMLGKTFLGSSKRADQKVYARMIESAKIKSSANNVSLDLLIAQPDIDVIVGAVK